MLRSPAIIEDCVIRSSDCGVQFSSSARFTIRYTKLTGGEGAKIGVRLHSAGEGVIEHCVFEGWQYAVVAASPEPLRVSRVSVVGGVTAVAASCNANVTIDRLSVARSFYGIAANNRANVVARDCAFSACEEAVCVHEHATMTAWDCSIAADASGIGFRADGDSALLAGGSEVIGTKYGAWGSERASAELVGCHISGCEVYGAGASDAASIAVRACTLEGNGDGAQFIEDSSGEVVESRLSGNRRFAVGSWSSGRVELHTNDIRHEGDTAIYAGPGSNLFSDLAE